MQEKNRNYFIDNQLFILNFSIDYIIGMSPLCTNALRPYPHGRGFLGLQTRPTMLSFGSRSIRSETGGVRGVLGCVYGPCGRHGFGRLYHWPRHRQSCRVNPPPLPYRLAQLAGPHFRHRPKPTPVAPEGSKLAHSIPP